MLSASIWVPQTMLSSSLSATLAPQTTSSQLAPAHEVPQTMLSHSPVRHAVPHTMLSTSPRRNVPHTMLSPSFAKVPHTMLSASIAAEPHSTPAHAEFGHAVPHTMLSPSAVDAAPHTVDSAQALPLGLITPRWILWLPHRMVLLQAELKGYCWPAFGLARYFARSTAPLVLRKPAPCVSASYL